MGAARRAARYLMEQLLGGIKLPNVSAQQRDMGGGELVTSFSDVIGTTSTTFTFPKQQHAILLINKGTQSITVTINAAPTVLTPGQRTTQEVRFSAFSIVSASGHQEFEARAKMYASNTVDAPPNGLSAERPTGMKIGYMFYDTTLSKPVWWNGTNWKDAAGVNA